LHVDAAHYLLMKKPSGSSVQTQKPKEALGRSAATGQLVLKPAPKKGARTVSDQDIRAAVRDVIAGRKG